MKVIGPALKEGDHGSPVKHKPPFLALLYSTLIVPFFLYIHNDLSS